MQTAQLIKDCIKGKRSAQSEFYNLYASRMLGICYRYTKHQQDAEDILQEGFLKIFKNLDQFKQSGPLDAWIRRIMVNAAINYLRKHSRYRNDLQIESIAVHHISDENPEIKLDTKEIVECIRSLPLGYQTIFNLVAIEGFEHAEVAALLKMNINTVRSQYSRARALLILALKQQTITTQSELYGR